MKNNKMNGNFFEGLRVFQIKFKPVYVLLENL